MDSETTTVTILDRKYRLKVSGEEAEYLKDVANRIDTQAREYGKRYGYQDQQDLLAMVALNQITQMSRRQGGDPTEDTQLLERMTALDSQLDEALRQSASIVSEH